MSSWQRKCGDWNLLKGIVLHRLLEGLARYSCIRHFPLITNVAGRLPVADETIETDAFPDIANTL